MTASIKTLMLRSIKPVPTHMSSDRYQTGREGVWDHLIPAHGPRPWFTYRGARRKFKKAKRD